MTRSSLREKLTHKRRPSPTIHFAFPAVVLIAAGIGAALISSQVNSSYVRIEAAPSYVSAGDSFTVNIYAAATVPTNAIDIEVRYPNDQIEITGIDTGESVITIWTEEPYAEGGVLYLRGGVFRRGFVGEHLIARVNAKATESGTARIVATDATFLAGDGRGTTVALSETGNERAEVRISETGTLSAELAVGLVADVNNDGVVDFSDIQVFMSAWRTRSALFDFNGDGHMTFRDFGILLARAFFK